MIFWTEASLRSSVQSSKRTFATCEHCTITVSTTRKTIEVYRSNVIYELPEQPARPSTGRHPG